MFVLWVIGIFLKKRNKLDFEGQCVTIELDNWFLTLKVSKSFYKINQSLLRWNFGIQNSNDLSTQKATVTSPIKLRFCFVSIWLSCKRIIKWYCRRSFINFWYIILAHYEFISKINNLGLFKSFDPFLVEKFSNLTLLDMCTKLLLLKVAMWRRI